jgi:hypothetical protein
MNEIFLEKLIQIKSERDRERESEKGRRRESEDGE